MHVSVSINYRLGVSYAVNENNGSFISTLDLALYNVSFALAFRLSIPVKDKTLFVFKADLIA